MERLDLWARRSGSRIVREVDLRTQVRPKAVARRVEFDEGAPLHPGSFSTRTMRKNMTGIPSRRQ